MFLISTFWVVHHDFDLLRVFSSINYFPNIFYLDSRIYLYNRHLLLITIMTTLNPEESKDASRVQGSTSWFESSYQQSQATENIFCSS